jgi:chemotaxis protein MotB
MIPVRKHIQEDNIDSWLMSYADMITLLLCFFVIFVGASEPKKDKMSALSEGMAGKFGTVELATPFQGVFRSLQAVVENHQVLKDVSIEKGENTLSLEISSMSLYKDKTADFNEKMVPVLVEVAQTLSTIQFMDYRVIVEGHTNDVPVNNPYFPSNWELSSARASRVVRFFIDHGIKPERLRAVGYADTKPKAPNLDAKGNAIIANRELNERIVIKVEQSVK